MCATCAWIGAQLPLDFIPEKEVVINSITPTAFRGGQFPEVGGIRGGGGGMRAMPLGVHHAPEQALCVLNRAASQPLFRRSISLLSAGLGPTSGPSPGTWACSSLGRPRAAAATGCLRCQAARWLVQTPASAQSLASFAAPTPAASVLSAFAFAAVAGGCTHTTTWCDCPHPMTRHCATMQSVSPGSVLPVDAAFSHLASVQVHRPGCSECQHGAGMHDPDGRPCACVR